jgi:flagellar FliJ protein
MPARFQFRLESLLRVRKALEEEAKRRLALVILDLERAQARVDELKTAQREALESRRTVLNEAVDLDRWRATERFLMVVERRILEAEKAVQEAEIRVAEARKALLKAHQDHLILLRLKERRQEQHALEVLHEETREMDEIAVLRYHFTHRRASNS